MKISKTNLRRNANNEVKEEIAKRCLINDRVVLSYCLRKRLLVKSILNSQICLNQ